MSLISGLVTFPLDFVVLAYKQAFQYRLLQQGSEIIHRSDTVKYAQALRNLPGFNIKTAMEEFPDNSGVRKDVIFSENYTLGFYGSTGMNIFRKGDAIVFIAPGFYGADTDACSWVVKREISHIKYGDNFMLPFVSAIYQLAASIFGMCFLSFFPALGLAFTVGGVSRALFNG